MSRASGSGTATLTFSAIELDSWSSSPKPNNIQVPPINKTECKSRAARLEVQPRTIHSILLALGPSCVRKEMVLRGAKVGCRWGIEGFESYCLETILV